MIHVNLNEDGMKKYGSCFPDGKVPVKTIMPQDATLEGKTGVQRVYLVPFHRLKDEQFNKVAAIIAEKNNSPLDEVKDYLGRLCNIPLPVELTKEHGAIPFHMFV